MNEDYRRTEYDLPNVKLKEKKLAVETLVKNDHPRAKDMHAYISRRKDPYRKEFIKAYEGRCAYCGVSTIVISSDLFEIDHFKYEKSFLRKADAGFIDNLVLACHSCNQAKRDFEITEKTQTILHPDNNAITNVFVRDDAYYIRIQDPFSQQPEVNDFYSRLGLGGEIHRLDFLLMSMNGLREKIGSDHKAAPKLDRAINLLHTRRNIGVHRNNE